MSARDDLAHAGDAALAQVREAREALAASREARTGGRAKDAREAERQLHALRDAVGADVRALRDRLTGLEPAARRGAATAALAGAGTVAALLGSGLAVRSSVRRAVEQRGVQRQAVALASAMAQQLVGASTDAAGRSGRRRGGRGALLLLAAGAAVAGGAVVRMRRMAPVDDADLWLPEQGPGPA